MLILILSFSDPSGALNFSGKAVLHASGVDFSNGSSFAINMDQLQLDEELGRGNYGTVKKVLHKPTKVAMAMKVCLYPHLDYCH
jgi:mitogen-activated protein kinase kinase